MQTRKKKKHGKRNKQMRIERKKVDNEIDLHTEMAQIPTRSRATLAINSRPILSAGLANRLVPIK